MFPNSNNTNIFTIEVNPIPSFILVAIINIINSTIIDAWPIVIPNQLLNAILALVPGEHAQSSFYSTRYSERCYRYAYYHFHYSFNHVNLSLMSIYFNYLFNIKVSAISYIPK